MFRKIPKVIIIAVLILLISGLIIIHKRAVLYNGGHSRGDHQRQVQDTHVTGEPRKFQAEEEIIKSDSFISSKEKIAKSDNVIPPKKEIVIDKSLSEQKVVPKKPNYQEDNKHSNENSQVEKNIQHSNTQHEHHRDSPQLDVHQPIDNNLNQAKNQVINSQTNKNRTINQRIYPSPNNNLNQARIQRINNVLQDSARVDRQNVKRNQQVNEIVNKLPDQYKIQSSNKLLNQPSNRQQNIFPDQLNIHQDNNVPDQLKNLRKRPGNSQQLNVGSQFKNSLSNNIPRIDVNRQSNLIQNQPGNQYQNKVQSNNLQSSKNQLHQRLDTKQQGRPQDRVSQNGQGRRQDLVSQSGQGRRQDQISHSGQARAQNTELIYTRLPSEQEVARMDFTTLTAMYHKYVNTKQATCRNLVRIGNILDGGWDICDDLQYRPRFNSCLVFSFGINFDFSFDDAITKKYGCEVHAFDPSMKKADHKRSEKIWFHATGLSTKDGVQNGWPMKRFSTIRHDLGKSRTPVDVLKIDIELWELQVIPELVKSGTLRDVKQFVVEIHLDLFQTQIIPSRDKYIEATNCFRYLYDDGFRIIYAHKNPYCLMRLYTGKVQRWGCHEISFVRM